MVNDLDSRQILALAGEGCTAAEIAKSLDIEEALVKLVVSRHEVGSAADRDINDDQLAILRRHAFNLATVSEDEGIQARMTMFLLERDKPSGPKQISSITTINQALLLANDSFQKLAGEFKDV